MANSVQLEASEAWRKAGFLVQPFHGHDEEDAKRFHKQILMAMYLKLVITPLKVDTGDERADIFTKAMPKGNGDYYRFRDDLMNVSSRVP